MNSDPSSNQDQQNLSSSTSESANPPNSEQQLADSVASELENLALDPEVEAASDSSTEARGEQDTLTDIWFDDEEAESQSVVEATEPELERESSDTDIAEASTAPVNQSDDTESSAIDTETASAVDLDAENLEETQNLEADRDTDIADTAPIPATKPKDTEVVQTQVSTEESNQVTEPRSQVKIQTQVDQLQIQKQALEAEIQALQNTKNQLLSQQLSQVQLTLSQLIQENTQALQQEKQTLQSEIERLQRRRDRIAAEMRTNFAGVSQDLAIRVQGFKQYLVGSLQDLAAAAEQLDLPQYQSAPPPPKQQPSPQPTTSMPQLSKSSFAAQTKKIRQLLEQYRTRPDYYGPPWQLRRTFEPIHAERVQEWFFDQGGKGAIRSMGSRLQNILIASAVISIMHALHGNRCCTLILSETPERLGEWRRGLQDCLGISRSDFSPNRGVVLFETPEPLVQKAERLVGDRALPLIIIDETEEKVNLSLLQFPLWLAFAPDPQQMSSYTY